MSYVVHRRVQEDREVYRIWSTNVDRYVTEEISWKETEEFFLGVARETALDSLERMKDRVLKFNTSSLISARGPRDNWQTELCRKGSFHHDFRPSSKDSGICFECGEPPEDHGHLPDCLERG